MAFLSEQDQQALRAKFAEEMQKDVRLLFFTKKAPVLFIPGQPQEDLEFLRQAQQLMEEIVGLSPKLSLDVYDIQADAAKVQEHHIDKLPALLLQADHTALRFFGLPTGYEFSTFVQDVLDLSRGEVQLSEETQSYLKGLQQDLHVQVFVTPT